MEVITLPQMEKPRVRECHMGAVMGFEPLSLGTNHLAPGHLPLIPQVSTQEPLLWRPSRLPQGVSST